MRPATAFGTGTAAPTANLGNWLTLWNGNVIANDDGIYAIDVTSETVASNPTGVDNWSFTAGDAQNLYAINSSHVDGLPLQVGAYDSAFNSLWQQNTYGQCRIDAADGAGGIAVDGGTLIYAPLYSAGAGVTLSFDSGVYAFDGASGTQKWYVTTTPQSTISVGGGLVYLVESSSSQMSVFARKQSDGSVAWSQPLQGASAQAPVLALGKVITATSTAIVTFDAATGTPAGRRPSRARSRSSGTSGSRAAARAR
jgi:outer membrane protein assembly factor BamB